jgi:hypothetical protein
MNRIKFQLLSPLPGQVQVLTRDDRSKIGSREKKRRKRKREVEEPYNPKIL